MNPRQKFRYLINFGSGFEEVEPIVPDIKFNYEKSDGQAFYRHVMNTELLFCKNDFKKLYVIESSCGRCEPLDFKVEICCGGTWSTYWEGNINLNTADFNIDKCQVTIKPEPRDKYDCVLSNWKTKVNVINCTDKLDIEYYLGTIECETCTEFNTTFDYTDPYPVAECTPPLLASDGWNITRNCLFGVRDLADIGIDRLRAERIETIYCREFFADTTNTQPPGTGWLSVAGGWARPIPTVLANTTVGAVSGIQVSFDVKQTYNVSGLKSETVTLDNGNEQTTYTECTFSNGMKLGNVINCLLKECDLELKSNFFGWNGDGIFPDNTAYECAQRDLQCLAVFDWSDIVLDRSTLATKAEITLEKLLECLSNAFQVKWKIIDGFFCLEHCSFYESEIGLDLTTGKKADCIHGYNRYSFVDGAFPKREVFNWANSGSDYFDGNDIVYADNCSKDDEKEYNVECFNVDLDYGVQNFGETELENFYLVSLLESNGIYYINDGNKPLSWTNIHECYYCFNRPQFQGTVNGELKCFESAQRLRQQVPFDVPLNCNEIKDFDPKKLVKTQLGSGEIASFELSTRNCFANITVVHSTPKCCS